METKTIDTFLGNTYIDRITGFEGVCTGHVYYLTGCDQLLLWAKSRDGKPGEGCWFDVQRCDQKKDAERIVLDNGKTPGFDAAPPVR
jgi:hypothetical protein